MELRSAAAQLGISFGSRPVVSCAVGLKWLQFGSEGGLICKERSGAAEPLFGVSMGFEMKYMEEKVVDGGRQMIFWEEGN